MIFRINPHYERIIRKRFGLHGEKRAEYSVPAMRVYDTMYRLGYRLFKTKSVMMICESEDHSVSFEMLPFYFCNKAVPLKLDAMVKLNMRYSKLCDNYPSEYIENCFPWLCGTLSFTPKKTILTVSETPNMFMTLDMLEEANVIPSKISQSGIVNEVRRPNVCQEEWKRQMMEEVKNGAMKQFQEEWRQYLNYIGRGKAYKALD